MYVLPWGCEYGSCVWVPQLSGCPPLGSSAAAGGPELYRAGGPIWLNLNRGPMSEPGFAAWLPFNLPRTPASKRIGPHNIDVISVIIGNMLGDGWGENRVNNPRRGLPDPSGPSGTRFHIHMGSPNVEYLMWLHKFFSERGYCSSFKPRLKRNINKGNVVYFSYKFRTWTYSSLNWIYHAFYTEVGPGKKIKVIPAKIEELLTPLALAIWIMDDGGEHPSGMIISTYCFSMKDIILLQKALKKNYEIETNVQLRKAGYILYIPKSQLPKLSKIVKNFMVPSMYYKLNGN